MNRNAKFASALTAALALSGCGPAPLAGLGEVEPVHRLGTAPPGAAPGTCWGKDVSPAVVETVTEQILLQPAEILGDGTVVEPAIYKTETRQKIVKERRETWFETPCAVDLTPEFVASVQRALKARNLFFGPVNGRMDRRTLAAIRSYQKQQGLNSSVLSIAAARQLGLIAIPRDELG